jgi:hypothetical protein
VDDRTKDERWVDGYSVKVWLFILDELPECLFGKGLGGCISAAEHQEGDQGVPRYLSPPGASRPFSSQTPALYSFQSFSVKLYIRLFDEHRGKDVRVGSLNSGIHNRSDRTGYQRPFGTISEYLPGNDDPLNLWVVLLNRLQDTNSSIDCWVEKLLGIIGLHMERRGCMGNSIDSLDSFVECSILTSAITLSAFIG